MVMFSNGRIQGWQYWTVRLLLGLSLVFAPPECQRVLRKYTIDPGGMMAEIISSRFGRRESSQRWEPGMRVVAPLVAVNGSSETMVPYQEHHTSAHLHTSCPLAKQKPGDTPTMPINGLGLGNAIKPSSVCISCSLEPGPIFTV